jgi:hypothetical protein
VVLIVGAVLSSVTVRVAVDVFPAVSVAVTVMVFGPPAAMGTRALQVVVPVAEPDAGTDGFDQAMLATPTLSLAVPPMARGLAFVTALPVAFGSVISTAGATESCLIVIVSVLVLPAVSVTVTVMALSPATSAIGATVQEVVPVTTPTAPFAALTQVTVATPTLSEAVPPSAIDAADVRKFGSAVGLVIVTVGTVASNVTARTDVAVLPAVSVAVTVMVLRPLVSGTLAAQVVVPVATPVPPVAELDQVTFCSWVPSEAVPPKLIGAMLVT